MHLTSFAPDDDFMSIEHREKWSLQELFKYLRKQKQNIDALWQNIQVNPHRLIVLPRAFVFAGHRAEDHLSR